MFGNLRETFGSGQFWAACAVTLVIILAIAACSAGNEIPGDSETGSAWVKLDQSIGYGLYRYQDDEAGVVCWVYAAAYKAGVDCLPLAETELRPR